VALVKVPRFVEGEQFVVRAGGVNAVRVERLAPRGAALRARA